MKKWTEEEINFLKNNYSKDNIEFCADVLNRSKSSITTKASRLKLTKSIEISRFTEEDVSFLIDNYKTLGVHLCAEYLGRDYMSVALKASRLNLTTKNSKDHKTNKYYVYNIYFPELNLYKVGFTTSLSRRFLEFKTKVQILELFIFSSKKEAKLKEMELLLSVKDFLIDTGLLRAGNSETYKLPA